MTRTQLSVAALIVVSFAFAGCSKLKNMTGSNTAAPASDTASTLTTPVIPAAPNQTEMVPVASPTITPASTTSEAVTNENIQLNAVNKDATGANTSLTDTPGTVN